MELLLFPFIVAVFVFLALVVVHEITYKGSWVQKIWGSIRDRLPKPEKVVKTNNDERISVLKTIHETLEEIEFALLECSKGKKSKSQYTEELKEGQEELLKVMEKVWKTKGAVDSNVRNGLKSLNNNIKRVIAAVTKEN